MAAAPRSSATASLNVPPQDFKDGFPGVFDDGARLYLDDQLIADNDRQHQPEDRTGSLRLTAGIHRIRVSYCQGLRYRVAAVLQVAGSGEQLRIFSTGDFKPPEHPENWVDPDYKPPEKPPENR